MIDAIQIQCYRGINDLTIHPLGRINLIVGKNATGKSSVLEAIELASGIGDPMRLRSICVRRGEVVSIGSNGSQSTVLDPRHLFHQHQLDSEFSIRTSTTGQAAGFTANFSRDENSEPARLILAWTPGVTKTIDLVASKGTSLVSMFSGAMPWDTNENKGCLFVPSSGLSQLQMIHELDTVLLTDDESVVLDSLRIIDPSIERIAVNLDSMSQEGRFGGVIVNSSGHPPRMPIGVFGEGIWRLLGIALGLTYCRNGVLLIDDIDSGLHHSVMEKMWHLIAETAQALKVQVFATTHSRDCVEALASIARDNVYEGSEVMIHRIESGKTKAVSYSEAAITAVAEFGNEVR